MNTTSIKSKCYKQLKLKEDKIRLIMTIAKLYSINFSDDPSNRIGAIFIDDNYQILSVGCNHSPYSMKFNNRNNANNFLTNNNYTIGKLKFLKKIPLY